SLLEEINALKIELAAKNEQFSYAEEKLVTISKDLQETENKKIAFSEDLQLLMAEMSDNTSGEEQLQAEAERRLLDKNETLELLKLRRDERVQLHTKVEDLEGELKEL